MAQAVHFLNALDPEADKYFFTAIHPTRTRGSVFELQGAAENGALDRLATYNERGFGIYVTINEVTGDRRVAHAVSRVRAVFVDLDKDADLQALLQAPLPPHMIVRTRADRLQAFWRVDGVSREHFSAIQTALAQRFGGDNVQDLPRLMRLPGYANTKAAAEGFVCELVQCDAQTQPYDEAQLLEDFSIDLNAASRVDAATLQADSIIEEGSRDNKVFSLAVGLAKRGATEEQVLIAIDALNDHFCHPPLTQREVKKIARSAANYSDAPRDEAPSMEEASIKIKPPLAEEFALLRFSRQECLVGPIHTQQIIHCSAAPGVGKTQLGIALADAVARGSSWAHWIAPQPRGVLFVDGEMPGSLLQERLALYGLDARPAPLRVLNAISWVAKLGLEHPNLADPAWQSLLEAWSVDVDLLVIDNVMSLFSVAKTSMSSDEFWRPAYEWSLRQRAAGRTVLFLDHTNSMGEVFGTKVKRWNADLCIDLATPKDHPPAEGCRFTLKFNKVRGLHGALTQPFEAALGINVEGQAMWTHRALEDAQAEQIADLAAAGLTQREIAEELRIGLATVNRRLQAARRGT